MTDRPFVHNTFSTPRFTALSFCDLPSNEAELVRNWRNHPDIKRWMYTDHEISPEEHRRYLEGLKRTTQSAAWLVKDPAGIPRGVVNLSRIDDQTRNAYIGIYAAPESAPKGTGTLLIEVLKTIAFEHLRLSSLKLEVFSTNISARSFYTKMGFMEESTLREYATKDGALQDVIVMAMGQRS